MPSPFVWPGIPALYLHGLSAMLKLVSHNFPEMSREKFVYIRMLFSVRLAGNLSLYQFFSVLSRKKIET
jgi:hypothetical protein